MLKNEKYDILDQEGALLLAKGILDKVNTRIAQRIVQTLDLSDTKHVPSAAAVLKAINTSRHATITTVTGNIDEVIPLEERSTSVLYFQRDTAEDTTWKIFIWNANPELQPDPDGQWICLGDTEIDLSNYWSKSSADLAALSEALGVDTLQSQVIAINGSIETLNNKTTELESGLADVNAALDEKVNRDELIRISEEYIDLILNYAASETDPFVDEAATVADINSIFTKAAVAGKTNVSIELTSNIDLTDGDAKIEVPAGTSAIIKIPEDKTVSCAATAFTVGAGGSLILSGEGTIKDAGTAASGAIRVEEGGSVTLNGITLDCVSEQGVANNYAYGIYAKNNATINFISGTIKVGSASCISTNNNTGGCDINIYDGELLSEACYAVYVPSQCNVNITGGTIQGISARMGTINISGDAKIIPTGLNSSNAVDIGANINTSGSIELGDTISIMAGSYLSGEKNTDLNLTISEGATVASSFRSAIGIYDLDTKEAAEINVTVAKKGAVTTTDTAFDAITVYDHAYIADKAAAAGKAYNPVAQSTITVKVANETIYPTI